MSTYPQGDSRPFAYGDWARARSALLEALQGPRLYALIVGASGMGKSQLASELSAALDRRRHHLVYVAPARASVVGLVRLCARELHLRPRRSHLETAVAVAQTIAAQTTHWVLWLDDADEIATSTLAELRTLVEPVPTAAPVLSVVLGGPPALRLRLAAPALFPLQRRIGLSCLLAGLRRDELEPFLEHRFGAAAAARLPSSVRDELFERTAAAPALLDRVVRQILHRQPQGAIDEDQVHGALDSAGL